MTDQRPDDPQREVQRLTAELARRERENTDLKQELVRTQEVQGDLWSHDIYLKARRKMLGGVLAVLGVLSAFGLVTVYDLYEEGLKYFNDKMLDTISARVEEQASTLVLVETRRIIEKADKEMDERIAGFETENTNQMSLLFDKSEKLIKAQAAKEVGDLINEKTKEINSLIAVSKTKIDKQIAELNTAIKKDRLALSDQARQIRLGMAAPAIPERKEMPVLGKIVVCDLDDAQIKRVRVQQLSEDTGGTAINRKKVFKNTFFLDVEDVPGADETKGAAEAECILDGVDRVVYGADPNWYSPSEFVRFDRKDKFRFTISGWGPTEVSAQVYFIGRRDPLRIQGNLTMIEAKRDDKRYLGDAPIDF